MWRNSKEKKRRIKMKKVKTHAVHLGRESEGGTPHVGGPTFVEIIKPQALSFIFGEFEIQL